MVFSPEFISLFKSIFHGRQDVHAIRWEKDGKSGYMPAYKVDWNDYKKYKSAGVCAKTQRDIFELAVLSLIIQG